MKKHVRKNNNLLIVGVMLFITIIIIAGAFLFYIYTQNYIKVENIDNKAKNQKAEVIKEAKPIYINNLLIGGVSKDKWVDNDNIYKQEDIVKQEKIDIYELTGKVGTYDITAVNREAKENNIYIKTDRLTSSSEYLAVSTSEENISIGQTTINDERTDEDLKTVKNALRNI